jgi:putative transposase
MARKTRIEFPGAIYHVLDRGDRREAIYTHDDDRRAFLATLSEACVRTGWRIHAYVLMSNHYHLMLETPLANLCKGMHWFQTTWTMRFNRSRGLSGHVLQGRYKAVVVDPEAAAGYFAALSDYIHLNPARAGLLKPPQTLGDYPWSSYPSYVTKRLRPSCLQTAGVLGELGLEDSAAGRRRYAERMQRRTEEELTDQGQSEERRQFRRGWCLGGEAFRERMLGLLGTVGQASRDSAVVRDHGEAEAKRLLDAGLKTLGLGTAELDALARGDDRKAALAVLIRNRTTVSSAWLAKALCMGHPSRITHSMKMPHNHPLRRKLEATLVKADLRAAQSQNDRQYSKF